MSLLQRIRNVIFPEPTTQTLTTSFVFPYSDDTVTKRQQVWENLEKGILFEDTGVLIPWLTPFSAIDKLAEQRRDGGHRTNWFLGKHQILDNYACYVGVMKWLPTDNSVPFAKINEWLGFDTEGYEKFLFLKHKLTDLLGEPTFTQLDEFGYFELGSVEWKNSGVTISLSGIEQGTCKYRMYIGLTKDKN